jgi:hypothetical protein
MDDDDHDEDMPASRYAFSWFECLLEYGTVDDDEERERNAESAWIFTHRLLRRHVIAGVSRAELGAELISELVSDDGTDHELWPAFAPMAVVFMRSMLPTVMAGKAYTTVDWTPEGVDRQTIAFKDDALRLAHPFGITLAEARSDIGEPCWQVVDVQREAGRPDRPPIL